MTAVFCTYCSDFCGPAVCHTHGRPDPERIAAAFVARDHTAASHGGAWNDTADWSWSCAHAICDRDPALAWDIILRALPHLRDRNGASFLGADLVEDFIRNWSEAWIEKIEERASCDARFRLVLTSVWPPSASDALWPRIAAIQASVPPLEDNDPLPAPL